MQLIDLTLTAAVGGLVKASSRYRSHREYAIILQLSEDWLKQALTKKVIVNMKSMDLTHTAAIRGLIKARSHYKLVTLSTGIRNHRLSQQTDCEFQPEWQHSWECMCRLRNIACAYQEKRDYQNLVTIGQTDFGQSDPYVSLCLAGDTKSTGSHYKK